MEVEYATLLVWRLLICKKLYLSYNPSIKHCWKGCDFAMGRVNTDIG